MYRRVGKEEWGEVVMGEFIKDEDLFRIIMACCLEISSNSIEIDDKEAIKKHIKEEKRLIRYGR